MYLNQCKEREVDFSEFSKSRLPELFGAYKSEIQN